LHDPARIGEGSDPRVAGAIREQRTVEATDGTGADIDCVDRLDLVISLLNGKGMVIKIEIDVLFSANDRFFLRVAKLSA